MQGVRRLRSAVVLLPSRPCLTDIAAIDREATLVLECTYKADEGLVRPKLYWFEKTPKHVQDRRVNSALQPYFPKIGEGASSCPLRE